MGPHPTPSQASHGVPLQEACLSLVELRAPHCPQTPPHTPYPCVPVRLKPSRVRVTSSTPGLRPQPQQSRPSERRDTEREPHGASSPSQGTAAGCPTETPRRSLLCKGGSGLGWRVEDTEGQTERRSHRDSGEAQGRDGAAWGGSRSLRLQGAPSAGSLRRQIYDLGFLPPQPVCHGSVPRRTGFADV